MKTKPLTRPARCKTGAKLRHDWAMQIKALPHSGDRIMEQFYDLWGKGWLKYANHANKCVKCRTYEKITRSRQ